VLQRTDESARLLNATNESSVFDLAGNREPYTNRDGGVFAYTLANAANEYATINTPPIGWRNSMRSRFVRGW